MYRTGRHVLQGVRQELCDDDPQHAASCKAHARGQQGTEAVHEEVARHREERLRERAEERPLEGLAGGGAAGHEHRRDGEALGDVVDANRKRHEQAVRPATSAAE